MKIKDVMADDIKIIKSDQTIKDAAAKMANSKTGVLTVKENDNVIGMITDRDIVVRSVAEGKNPEKTKVKEAMTPKVVYSFEDQSINDATKKMKENSIRRLLIFNREKKPIGMVSLVP
jgi:CBS domain-containing protein